MRSSLAGGTQACVETLDMLEFTMVFDALFLDPWKSLSDVESILEKKHKSPEITDAKSLFDALEKSESSTRNLTERRTAIEVTAVGQRLEHGFITTGWVNSDGLTKPQTAWKLLEIMSARKWKIVRLSRVQESSRWQDGQKAKEILMGDEFSMTILLNHVAF